LSARAALATWLPADTAALLDSWRERELAASRNGLHGYCARFG
jgi:hypothetical protein